MRTAAFVIVLTLVAAGVPSGAASAPLDDQRRQTGVTADADGGRLVLEPGPGEFATRGRDGAVVLGTADGESAGLNAGGRFVFGDRARPTSRPAFTLANGGPDPATARIGYRGGDGGSPDANLRFHFFDGSGERVATVDEEFGPVDVRIGGDESLHAVVMIDTRGLSSATDLSGTLVVKR